MNLFFAHFENNQAILDEKETHHLEKVLRLGKNDKVLVTDGKGKMFEGYVLEITKKQSLISLGKEREIQNNFPELSVAFAPTKSNERSEILIEKIVELGVRNIFPITSFHSERRKINVERWQKIADAATKQSLKAHRCQLYDLQDFKNFISLKKNLENKFIAHCNSAIPTSLLKNVLSPGEDSLILIGPEGDFSEDEIHTAIDLGYKSISFGNQRFRTETAGIYFASVYNFLNTFRA